MSVVASQDVDCGADENTRYGHLDGQIQGCADVDAADNRVGYRDGIDDESARSDCGGEHESLCTSHRPEDADVEVLLHDGEQERGYHRHRKPDWQDVGGVELRRNYAIVPEEEEVQP